MIRIILLLLFSYSAFAQPAGWNVRRISKDPASGARDTTVYKIGQEDSLAKISNNMITYRYTESVETFLPWSRIMGQSTGSVAWADVTGKPSSFAPSAHSHDYNSSDLTNKPTIPTATSQLTNDAGFLTSTTAKGYTLSVQALTSSPTDAQTVYFGQLPKAPVIAAATSKVFIPKAGTIKVGVVYCYSGTAGTNESWSLYVRVNNTTDYLIGTVSAATSERIFSNSSLSISVNVGDYIEIKSVQPTWATNPLTTIYGGYIYIE